MAATEERSAGGPEELAARVQQLTENLETIADPFARAAAEDLAGALMALYGEGLERIMEALGEAGEPGAAVRAKLEDDGVVGSLLLIHGMYPVDLEIRVQEGLDSVRPYMESHGGDVELVGVTDGVAHLRLEGHCRGCAASQATLELAIKNALEETAPDLLGLEVEGVVEPAQATHAPPVGVSLPIVDSGPTWVDLGVTVAPDSVAARSLAGRDLVVANVAGSLLAYRNACAACGARLEAGTLVGSVLACPTCAIGFDLRRAGEAVDGSGQLEPVPLLASEGGGARVAVGA